MQNRNLLALAIFSGLLTACGGSGDSDNNPADPNNPPPLKGPSPGLQYQHRVDPIDRDGSNGIINNNGNNQGGNNNNSGNNSQGNNQGNNPGNNNQGNTPGNNNQGNNPGGNNNGLPQTSNGSINNKSYNNQVNINNRTIHLLPNSIAQGAGSIQDVDDNVQSYRKLIGNNLNKGLYGVLIHKTDNSAYAFYQHDNGNITLPTTGMVRYNGLAIHYDVAKKEALQGTSTFDVDFGAAKSVNGKITLNGKAPIELSAKINGTNFKGVTNDKIETEGSFYGDNGAELSGTYGKPAANGSGKEYIGAFGAQSR